MPDDEMRLCIRQGRPQMLEGALGLALAGVAPAGQQAARKGCARGPPGQGGKLRLPTATRSTAMVHVSLVHQTLSLARADRLQYRADTALRAICAGGESKVYSLD